MVAPTATDTPDRPSERPARQATHHPITHGHWHFDHATLINGSTDPGWQAPGNHALQLDFSAHQVTLSGLCNQMAAGYTLDGHQLRFGQVTSTMGICANDALMQVEHAVGLHLPKAVAWDIPTPAELIISFDDGTTWTFHQAPRQ